MEINCESAAAVLIVNVPAKKVSPQGTHLTREKIGLPLIRYSMVYYWVSLGYFTVNLSGGQPKMY